MIPARHFSVAANVFQFRSTHSKNGICPPLLSSIKAAYPVHFQF